MNNLIYEYTKLILEAGKVSRSSPVDFVGNKDGKSSSRVQSKLMTKPIDDLTQLNVEETIKKLIEISGDNTHIHFLTSEDKMARKNIFSVSPNVNWGNFQGTFSYKLDKQGLVNLIQSGTPASGGYGAGSKLFQIFKIDDRRTIQVFDKNDAVNVKIPVTLFPITNNNFQKQVETLIKETFYLIFAKQYRYNEPKYNSSWNKILKLFFNAKQEDNIDPYLPKIKKILLTLTKKVYKDLYGLKYYSKNKEFAYFAYLKITIDTLTTILGISNNTTGAQYGSLLWNLIGVENIDDKGIGVIHQGEKAQAISFDFSGESITPIGTFTNYFREKPFGRYYKDFIDIISDSNVKWDFDIVSTKFEEISDPREWNLSYLKKMLKVYDPKDVDTNDDIYYYWLDSMEGALWGFSEHFDKKTGLTLLQYVIKNVPTLKKRAEYYYKELLDNPRDSIYWQKNKNRNLYKVV